MPHHSYEGRGDGVDDEPIVYIVDDDPGIRSSTVELLGSVGLRGKAYSSTRAFLEDYVPDVPGCLVLDVRIPVSGGLALLEKMVEANIKVPVLMISAFADVPTVICAMKRAFDFLEKPFQAQLFLDRVQTGIEQDRVRLNKWRRQRQRDELLASLTDREREVLRLIIKGHSNKVIAAELAIHDKTVEFHRSALMKRMGAGCVAELLACLDVHGDLSVEFSSRAGIGKTR